jgi:signal recognition particle subunit SRP54
MFETITESFSKVFGGLLQKNKLTEANIEDALKEVRQALLAADVNFRVARQFIDNVHNKAIGAALIKGVRPGDQFIKAVYDELIELMGPQVSPLEMSPSGPTIIMMCGLQGSGKTTTCAKLALWLKKQGRQPSMVAADIQRPAAVKQLEVLGEQIQVPVYTQMDGARPPDICRKGVERLSGEGRDVIIIDTAGRLHIDEQLMLELEEIAQVTKPHQILLVCDAMLGQDAVNSAKEFNDRLAIDGLILTKLDGDARGGAALSIKHVTGKPIKFVGIGEKIDDLDVFHPNRLVSRMLGMGDIVSLVEKAQENVDKDVAAKLQKKVLDNRVNLQDMLAQLEQMEKMGPLKDLLAMVPGMGKMLQQQEFDEGDMLRFKGIIQSMTRQERLHPEIIDGSRKRRISLGSGTTPQDVNRVLKEFQMMRKMIGGLTRHGRFNPMALLSGEVPLKGKTKERSRAMLRAERKKKRRKRRR